MLNKKLKLSPSVLKRYEPELGLYCFYDARTRNCINTDYVSGSVVAALDGTLSVKEIIQILLENNRDVVSDILKESLSEVFVCLLKEEFLDEID